MFSLAFLKLYLLFLQEFVLQKKNCPKLKLSVDVAGHKTLTVVTITIGNDFTVDRNGVVDVSYHYHEFVLLISEKLPSMI